MPKKKEEESVYPLLPAFLWMPADAGPADRLGIVHQRLNGWSLIEVRDHRLFEKAVGLGGLLDAEEDAERVRLGG